MSETSEPNVALCPTCGSRDVQALLWVELSTQRVVEDGDDFDTECFCPRCDSGFRFSALSCV